MRTNRIKSFLKEGKAAIGCFVATPSPMVVELCALLGFDFVVLDSEHGIADLETMENMVRAADASGVVPIARVAVNEPQIILRYMDAGALGAQLPQINTAEEAARVVAAVKYRPLGRRGLAGVRAADFGLRGGYADYIAQANEETLIAVHVETPEAVDHLPETVRVEGVDVFFIGPTDLSYSLGHPGEPGHAEVQRVIDTIIRTVRDAGKSVGIMTATAEGATAYIERGVQYVTTSDKSLFVDGGRRFLRGLPSARAS